MTRRTSRLTMHEKRLRIEVLRRIKLIKEHIKKLIQLKFSQVTVLHYSHGYISEVIATISYYFGSMGKPWLHQIFYNYCKRLGLCK
jgi:hypothetical protein